VSENRDLAHPAIAAGATLVTCDEVFDHVPGLAGKENWTSDLDK
jgi:hypothetical protein